MKANRLTGILMAVTSSAALLAAGAASADTVTLTVTAQIMGICKFNSGQAPVVTLANTGATIDPSLAGPATGQALILYKCTKGQAPTFTVPSPVTITCSTPATCGATTMAPTLSSINTGNGTGFSAAQNQTLTVTGNLIQTAYQDMQAGTYSNNAVTITVTP